MKGRSMCCFASIQFSSRISSEPRDIRKSKLPWKQRNSIDKSKMIRAVDESKRNITRNVICNFSSVVIFKVYCADHTYTTMKMRVDTPASKIIRVAADKLGLRFDQPDDLKLCEVKSTGGISNDRTKNFSPSNVILFACFSERSIYKQSDLSISHSLSLNGRLFLAPGDHLDALVIWFDSFAEEDWIWA